MAEKYSQYESLTVWDNRACLNSYLWGARVLPTYLYVVLLCWTVDEKLGEVQHHEALHAGLIHTRFTLRELGP